MCATRTLNCCNYTLHLWIIFVDKIDIDLLFMSDLLIFWFIFPQKSDDFSDTKLPRFFLGLDFFCVVGGYFHKIMIVPMLD